MTTTNNLFSPEDFNNTTTPNNMLYVFDDNNNDLLVDENGYRSRYNPLNTQPIVFNMKDFDPVGEALLQTKIVTPTDTEQIILPDEGYIGLNKVIVAPIPTIEDEENNG